jgi:predicted CXXCH cytochrome family protein
VKAYDVEAGTYNTTWSEIDVSCEACHGPGSEHVRWAEMPTADRSEVDGYGLSVRTDALGTDGFVRLCAPCHARRAEIADYDHRDRPLLDHILPTVLREGLYHPDGQILEEVYVYGSFLQSRMHQNQVRCADCHDAHSLELKADGNALCTQCHLATTYDAASHHFHESNPTVATGPRGDGALGDGTRCVQCHMVEQPFMVVDWRADHSIRIPRPDLTAEIDVPNACSQSGCHDTQPLDYVLTAYEDWYGPDQVPHYGQVFAAARAGDATSADLMAIATDSGPAAIVRATALTLLAPFPPMEVRAAFAAALSSGDALIRHAAAANVPATSPDDLLSLLAPLLGDSVRAVRIEAASRLADTPPLLLTPDLTSRLASTLSEYRGAMGHSLDFAASAYNLGNLSARLGDAGEAERHYRTAGGIDNRFVPAKVNLALLLNATGRNPEAEELLRQVLAIEPDAHGVAYNLGLLLAEMGRVDESVEFLGTASAGSLEPARVHYNYGLALQQLGRLDEAEGAFSRALSVEPGSADFLFALGDHYLQRGRTDAALEVADRLIAAAPQDPRGTRLRTAAQGAR